MAKVAGRSSRRSSSTVSGGSGTPVIVGPSPAAPAGTAATSPPLSTGVPAGAAGRSKARDIVVIVLGLGVILSMIVPALLSWSRGGSASTKEVKAVGEQVTQSGKDVSGKLDGLGTKLDSLPGAIADRLADVLGGSKTASESPAEITIPTAIVSGRVDVYHHRDRESESMVTTRKPKMKSDKPPPIKVEVGPKSEPSLITPPATRPTMAPPSATDAAASRRPLIWTPRLPLLPLPTPTAVPSDVGRTRTVKETRVREWTVDLEGAGISTRRERVEIEK